MENQQHSTRWQGQDKGSTCFLACLLTILLYLTWGGVSHASRPGEQDSIAAIADRLGRFCTHVPQEQVFVHMDNTCYFLGDTIYYKAYVVRADSLLPTDISGVLYVELLNQDGYLEERQTLRLRDGQAHGSFCLPDTAYAGYHELRAYTRWQLNWGVHEHPHTPLANKWFLRKDMAEDFFRDYDKLYSRVFPVYDKPQAPGEYLQEMTPRPLRRGYQPKSQKGGGGHIAPLPRRGRMDCRGTTGHRLRGQQRPGETPARATGRAGRAG